MNKTKEAPLAKVPFLVTVDMVIYADSAEDAKSKANFILNRGISYSPYKTYGANVKKSVINTEDPFKL